MVDADDILSKLRLTTADKIMFYDCLRKTIEL